MKIGKVVGAVAACSVMSLVAGCGPTRLAARADDVRVSLPFGGITRDYLVHQPAAGQGKRAAVLVFHGGGGTAAEMAAGSRFDQFSDARGFVAVYPEGYERSWNDGRGDDTKAGAAGIDDVGFVAAIIDQLVAHDNVDPSRVYATGISNGGILTEYLGCRLSTKLAAIAPVAAALPAADQCAPANRMPVLEMHGTADPIVPYDGGVVRNTSGHHGGPGVSPVLSVEATQRVWHRIDDCGPVTTATLPPLDDDGTSVTTQISNCADRTQVQLYSIAGGGHTWPGGPQYLPKLVVGPVSHQFNATNTIWQFFTRFHR